MPVASAAQKLCKVVRECETISCSGNKSIILGLYERGDFVFTYIKIHFISMNASIFHKCSQLVSTIPQFLISSSTGHTQLLSRTDVQTHIIHGEFQSLAHSDGTTTTLTQF